jgi:DNA uptake protein ComE-like DNA-binding protein
MKESLKDYFYFNKKERNGIIVLVILIIVVLVFNNTVHLFSQTEKIDNSEFENEIAEFKATLLPKDEEEYLDRLDRFIVEMYDTLDLFYFDPNTVTEIQWKNLGLTDKQIKTIATYKERGGKFYIKDDFRKIYGIRQKQFEILQPYILLPEKDNESLISEKVNYNFDSTFSFNPNKTNDSVWKMLGVADKQITTINKYLSKGGKFYKKEDLLKIYGLDQTTYSKIQEYVNFDFDSEKDTITSISIVQNIQIELNSATLEQISDLNHIGEYYAGKIIKFRDLLGGFYDKAQILEIYGIKQDIYDKIKDNVYIDENSVVKIRLNFTDFDELNAHPYIDYATTKAILSYRSNNGSFTKIEQLLKIETINQELFDKINNYLTVE